MDALDASRDIHAWLAHHEQKELLRFVTVGSVDDGKSTLIGRLLHDAAAVFDDQLAAVKRASARHAAGLGDGADEDEEIDFSLFTDGLRAEREQGITIDVAYRYFATARRKYILADTPGHVQYTRNMATGASTADVAIILLDARLGVLPQSRRHAYIASLLGIPELVVAVNKMDLAGYAEDVYARLRDEFSAFTARLSFARVTFLPISARRGDNVVKRSARTPWYAGPTLLEHLEAVPLARDREREPLRFPVQYVLRPHLDYRAFAGQIAAGAVHPGDAVVVLPSGRRTTVKAVDTWEGERDRAFAPMSVALRLADEVDIARGDMIAHPDDAPRALQRFTADLVWMHDRPTDPGRAYLVKHTTRTVPARIERVLARTELETLAPEAANALGLNDIGRVVVRCARPLLADPYATIRATGAFIVVDALTNETVGAGMIRPDDPPPEEGRREALRSALSEGDRAARLGHLGAVVWIAARPGADGAAQAAALAAAVERDLFDAGFVAAAIEGDDATLGATAVALARAGLVAVVAAAGVRAEGRAAVRQSVGALRFVGVGAVSGEGDDVIALPAGEAHGEVSAAVRAALEGRGLRAAPRS